MLVQSIANPPLPPPRQHREQPPSTSLHLPFPHAASSIQPSHAHVNLEVPSLRTFEPSSHHNANWAGKHRNYAEPGMQYQLATRGEQAKRRSRRRSPSPRAAGLESRGDTSGGFSSIGRATVKTIDTDLTRYQNSSSFRGTTPPMKLRYIFQPSREPKPDELVSDGRLRTWEEVPYDARDKPTKYRDRHGVEWIPVLGKDASEREWNEWEGRERRRARAWEDRERAHMAQHDGRHSRDWERDARDSFHPFFLHGRNRDGSSQLLTPTGRRPMTLLDSSQPWHAREYHHVGRDPLANYQTIFGGLEAEQERQRLWTEQEMEAEEIRLKHERRAARDEEHARRKQEKMMLRYDLEVQKLAARQKAAEAQKPQWKVVKKIIRKPDGSTEVVFVKRKVGGTGAADERAHTPDPKGRPSHAPWGSSSAAHRTANRVGQAERALQMLSPTEKKRLGIAYSAAPGANGARPQTASAGSGGGWLHPATRHQSSGEVDRSRSRTRSHSRSRSRSTSSSRRRRIRRSERALKAADKEERRRKKAHAKLHSAGVQAGPGEMPVTAEHPRASDLEAYMLKQSAERRGMSLERLGATLNSLEKLSIGGVGRSRKDLEAMQQKQQQARRGGRRGSADSSSSDGRSRSSSSSSSGFSSRSRSRSGSRGSRSRSRSPRPQRHSSRAHHDHRRRSRSASSASSASSSHGRHPRRHRHRRGSRDGSKSRSASRSRSASSASSSGSSSRKKRSNKRSHQKRASSSSTGHVGGSKAREWTRRESFESMDERVRAHSEAKWLRAWEKRFAKAATERQRKALKEEKREWQERRAQHHTLVQAATAVGPHDGYLQTPNTQSNPNATGVLTDQYGTPISSYGTVYPKPQGNLLQQASSLEAYTASLAYTDQLLEQTRQGMEASVHGIENIVHGLREGYATKGLDMANEKAQQEALHLSLRAAIRAREDRRKKTAAMQRANRNVLDELRRQESVIMARSQDVEETLANREYDRALKQQQDRLAAQQAAFDAQQALLLQQEAEATGDWSKVPGGRPPPLNGRRPKAQPNLGLGHVQGVKPYWYESAEPAFTRDMIQYNAKLKANLAQAGVRS